MIRRISFRKVLNSFQRIIAARHFLVITAITIGLSSCYNEPEILGGNLLPSEDLLSVKLDTSFEVSAYTVKTDSIPTSLFNYAVLGCTNSNTFGRIKADFFSQLLLSKLNDPLGLIKPRPIPDSLVLTMRLRKTWGTNNKAINIKVYESLDTLSNFLYYNGLNTVKGRYKPTLLSLSTTYSGDSVLRIRLTDDFATTLINAPDSAFISNSKFSKYMKGLFITSDEYTGTDGVLYFFYYNISLTLHYKKLNKAGVLKDTIFTCFTNTDSPRYNQFDHFEHLGASIHSIIGDTTIQNPVFYDEGLGGVRGLIKLKGAKEWAKKTPLAAINRAELRFDFQDTPEIFSDSLKTPIHYYSYRQYNKEFSTGSDDVVGIFDSQFPGGLKAAYYNKAKKYYSIDVTLLLQNILLGKQSKDYFYLEPANSSGLSDFKYNYHQGLFRSGSNSKPMKLYITYTKL